jgi:PAS domain S-box-containing protein
LPIVLEAILESANLLTSLQNAQIYLNEEECLRFGAALRLDNLNSPLIEPLPNSLTYAVAHQGEPINIPSLHNHPLYSDLGQQGALLGLPLKIGERVVGVMTIQYHQPHHWPEAELRVLNLLADQAAIAIENARLYAQAQQEIAERKRAEAKLNEYREHLEELVWERTSELEHAMREASDARDKTNAILQSVADGLIVTDTNYQVILANPAAEALLGVEVEDMLGREVGAGIRDDRLREMVRYAFEQRASGHEVDIETDDPNARKKVLLARTALVDDREGQPLGTVTIIQDVTRLREIDRLKTEFLTTTAHELRTPLTSILGFSEILLTRELNPERQKHYLSMINEQSSHLAKIVAELVDISRIESGQTLDLKLELVNLAALMENVMILCAEKVTKHHPRLEGLADLPPIWGDPFRLSQVGQNLLLNAINYSPLGSAIIIRGQLKSDFIQIGVQDQGIGMTPEQQKHLFEPFYRAHASDTSISGTGLGLATSKLIIEQHGGKIWLDSEVDVGTTVYFTLPLTRKTCEPGVRPDPA